MNASRTVAFASPAPVAAAQDAAAAAWPPVAGRPRGTARKRRPDPQWPWDREGRGGALLPGGSEPPGSRDYQQIEDAWPRPRHPARRPRHHLGLRPARYARSAGSSPRASAVAAPHHIDAWHGWSPDVEADGRSATIRAPGPGHRHHLDRHRHSQDRAHLTPPDQSAREGPDQRTDIKMTEPTDNELRPLSRAEYLPRSPRRHCRNLAAERPPATLMQEDREPDGARTGNSVPLGRSELANDRQCIVGVKVVGGVADVGGQAGVEGWFLTARIASWRGR
jgi:hypothetical protein